jgi:signal transduction histidine kinase
MIKSQPQPSPAEVHQRLVEQYTEIATLAGGLAHEIKNPLSTIRLNMELLAEDFGDPQSPRDRRALAKIATVQRECQRLQNLLDDFLNFARQGRIHLEPSNLNQELERILEFFRPKADESGVDLFCYFDPELPSLMLDREAFQGAVLNLLLNAQQAMPEGGQLTIRTRTTPHGVALDLIDTGCGMDEQTLSKIFKAFYSTKPGGSGLGLATTRKIIDAHRGRISVLSEVGRGTQFVIELPVPPRLAAK